MRIELAKILEQGSRYSGTLAASTLGLENDPCQEPDGDLQYELTAELLGSELLVRGTTRLPLKCTCARCAEIFSTSLEDSSFLRAYEIKPGQFDVDLTPDLRESIILILPSNPLCRPDCKGLCPGCSVNLNEAACQCTSTQGDLRWTELDQLEIE